MVKRSLSNEHFGKWLMVVDNYDDELVFECSQASSASALASPRGLSSHLPVSQNGSIVLTSRNSRLVRGTVEHESDIIHVGPVEPMEGTILVRKKLLEQNVCAEHVSQLAHELDYIPMALAQACALMNAARPGLKLSQYIQEIPRSNSDRVKIIERAQQDVRHHGGNSVSILKTWHISFEYLRRTRTTAADLLALMSMYNPEAIQEELLRNHYSSKSY